MIKCCKNCNYRIPDPNCHMSCKEYIKELEEHIQQNIAKSKDTGAYYLRQAYQNNTGGGYQ